MKSFAEMTEEERGTFTRKLIANVKFVTPPDVQVILALIGANGESTIASDLPPRTVPGALQQIIDQIAEHLDSQPPSPERN